MGTAETPPTTDFWSRVPRLLELARSIGVELEESRTTEAVGARSRLHQLAEALPETAEPLRDVDPYLANAILTAAVHALRAEGEHDRDDLRLAVERLRQALRDVDDEQPIWRAGPKDAAVWLREQGLAVSDLAELLSVAESTVRRWTNVDDDVEPSGHNAERLIVLAKIVNHLRHAMTPRGVVQWLLRPHPELDDRRPVDDLKDPESYRHLIHLASGSRSVVAS